MIDTIMAITTEGIPHLPAVLATYRGHVNREDVERMYADTARLLAGAGDRYYRISDVRGVQMDYHDFMGILLALGREGPFRSGDPKLKVIFVGHNPWLLSVKSVMASKGVPPLMCETLEEAIALIEADCDAAARLSG